MTHMNTIEIIISFLLSILMIIALWAFHEFGKETITEEEASVLMKEFCQHEYDSLLTKIKLLNVGDIFTKDSALKYDNHTAFYGIWCDVKIQEKDRAMYELKGGFTSIQSADIDMQWRYYIKTENDRIISIKKV